MPAAVKFPRFTQCDGQFAHVVSLPSATRCMISSATTAGTRQRLCCAQLWPRKRRRRISPVLPCLVIWFLIAVCFVKPARAYDDKAELQDTGSLSKLEEYLGPKPTGTQSNSEAGSGSEREEDQADETSSSPSEEGSEKEGENESGGDGSQAYDSGPSSSSSSLPSPSSSPYVWQSEPEPLKIMEGNTSLPTPLDYIAGKRDAPCPIFMNSFLASDQFKACYPLSMLLQDSQSFFNSQKSLVTITQVLDATCAANVDNCIAYFDDLAMKLVQSDNCGAEFESGQPTVVHAYLSMVSYQPLYSATCLTDPDTSVYCYAGAVTNLTTPTNAYFYYMPLNISIDISNDDEGHPAPACGWCLEQTMNIFHTASANMTLPGLTRLSSDSASTSDGGLTPPLRNTYPLAARAVNSICEAGFVNETLPAPSSATRTTRPHDGGRLRQWTSLVTAMMVTSLVTIL